LQPFPLFLGPGIRRRAKERYDDAVERNAILHSLVPVAPAAQLARSATDRAATNERVLDQFQRSLLQQGPSTKIVARDVRIAQALADGMAQGSLRECTIKDLEVHMSLAALVFASGRETVTALKRLFKFLQATERMPYGDAQNVLEWLAKRP
jgi:hypothetical protein